VAGVAYFVVSSVLTASRSQDPNDESFWNFQYSWGWDAMAVQFFLATVATNIAEGLVRKKRWDARLPLFVSCIVPYLLLVVWLYFVGIGFRRPAVHAMQFMACMLSAHYWGIFKESPEPRHAWKALWAFLVAAGLFFLVSYFGEDFAQFVCGTMHLGTVM